jgi:hypothetical protein
VVAFDDVAAIELGLHFPAATLKSLTTSTGLSSTYLKYDALIAACALRHRAEHLVTVNRRLHPQVPQGLKVTQPCEFRARQGVLVEVPQTVAVGTALASRPPHGSERAGLPHSALALSPDVKPLVGPRVNDSSRRKPAIDEATHSRPVETTALAAAKKCPMPTLRDLVPE